MRGVVILILLTMLSLSVHSEIGALYENTSTNTTSLLTWIGVYNPQTDSTNETSSLFSAQDLFFIAEYNNASNQTIVNASCLITFDSSKTHSMNYSNLSSRELYYTETDFSPGQHNYNVTCSAVGFDNLSVEANFTVSGTFQDSGLAATGVQYSSLVWGDLDNDDDWDLIYTGYNMGLANVQYCENDEGLTCSDSSLPLTTYGSISLGDVDNDDDLDIAVSGNIGSRILRVYDNNDSAFTLRNDLTGTYRGSTMLFDMDRDGILDLLNTGSRTTDSWGSISQIHYGNRTDFINPDAFTYLYYSTITPLYVGQSTYTALFGSNNLSFNYGALMNNEFNQHQDLVSVRMPTVTVLDINNDGLTDIVVTGTTTTVAAGSISYVYLNNGTHMEHISNLTGAFQAATAAADYNNDGFTDLVIIDSQNAIFYKNNGTDFINEGSYGLPTFNYGSIAFFDYDDDGDSDLAVSGGGNMMLLENNASLFRPNLDPLPPTDFNSSFDGTWLNLSWNRGTDDITPTDGLYYNLRVGTLPGQYDIISGKYGGTSNPTQGYIGNMMQLRDYSINVSQNRTYYYQVQAIDGSLSTGNWSEEQVFDPYGSIVNGTIFNVTTDHVLSCSENYSNIHVYRSLSILNCNLTLNGTIQLYNGSLIVRDSHLSSQGIHTVQGTVLDVSDSYIDNVMLNTSNASFSKSVLENTTIYPDDVIFQDSNLINLTNLGNNISLINTTYTNANIIGGYLNIMYYLHLDVIKPSLLPLANTNVKVYSDNILQQQSLTTLTGTDFTLNSYIYNGSIINRSHYNISFSRINYIEQWLALNLTANTEVTITMNISPIPDYSEFTWSTNFSQVPDLENVSQAFIGIAGIGLINYTQAINVSNQNLTELIEISHNHIEVNPVPGINKSAIITIYDLNYTNTPIALKDGSICTNCTTISYDGNFSFAVNGFSTYSAVENSDIAVSVTNGISTKIIPGDTLYVNVSYINRTSSGPIIGFCSLDTGGLPIDIPFDGQYYIVNHSIPRGAQPGYTLNYTVNCTSPTFETQTFSSTVTLVANTTLLTEVMQLEGVAYGASIVFSQSNTLLLVAGDNNTASFGVYNRSENVFVRQQRFIEGISCGSLASFNTNNDNILEIIQTGYNQENLFPLIIYKKNN